MVVDSPGPEHEARHLPVPTVRSPPRWLLSEHVLISPEGDSEEPPPARPHGVRAQGAEGWDSAKPGRVAPIQSRRASAGGGG